jgi:galactitol-specific phosphotransferase system IIB component
MKNVLVTCGKVPPTRTVSDHRHTADIIVTTKRVATPAVPIAQNTAGVGAVAEQLGR